ncbi:MAG: VWA domain-containing protein [Anaerolineales bacterium]|nr:VWA domain-containing protein [Anaerolineales bacterium]MCA9978204.1 VWA domain-containing protein [Anaerolineales bacterium]
MSYQFAAPWFLLLLLLIPALALLAARRPHPPALRYADVTLAQTAVSSWRITLRPVLAALRWLALALLIVALARPQRVTAQQVVRGEGVDIALALDISGSMAALDFQPENRLEAAKRVITEFVQKRPFDRIGLVVFARDAFTQSPLTVDHNVLDRLLADIQLGYDLGLDDGTAIGMGLANAANMLKDSDAVSKVVILLTDGVNNSGQIDPLTAAQAAQVLGIKVYAIGVGREGQVPVPQQGLFGTQIVYQESELDEETLMQIATMTNGRFYRAADANELRQIYDEIDQLEKSQVEIRVFHQYDELARWLLLPALFLLLVELVLRQTIFRQIP